MKPKQIMEAAAEQVGLPYLIVWGAHRRNFRQAVLARRATWIALHRLGFSYYSLVPITGAGDHTTVRDGILFAKEDAHRLADHLLSMTEVAA